MSKIAFFCIPAHGHTNPTLAVVKELVNRGNEVRYYSYNSLKDKIEATGATFISCDAYDTQRKLSPEDGERIATDLAFSVKLMVEMTLAMDDTIIKEMAQWKPDCIVSDSMATWGKLAALKLGIPLMSSTTTFAFNRYSSRIMKQSFAQTLRTIVSMSKANKYVKQLCMKGYPVKNALSLISNENDTNTIVYTSPKFQPCAETFSEHYTFVGPSVNAAETLLPKSERKTVYISLGTVNNMKTDFYKVCIDALGNTEFDVIISVGEYTDLASLGTIPDNIKVYPRVNQIEVLQRTDAFLTHCGMNSVNEALYYGVPLILYPQTPEQNAVAFRVNELGAGAYLKDASVQGVLRTIHTVLEDANYQKNAQMISEDFHSCGGYKLAADKIEALAK